MADEGRRQAVSSIYEFMLWVSAKPNTHHSYDDPAFNFTALLWLAALFTEVLASQFTSAPVPKTAFHIIVILKDKQITANHDSSHKSEDKIWACGTPARTSARNFSLSLKLQQVSGWHLEDASLQLCWRSFALWPKGLISWPMTGHSGTNVAAQLVDIFSCTLTFQ